MPMPVSTATNAYDLLDDVKALALEEPKRIAMGWWLVQNGYSSDALLVRVLKGGFPECGTVGCVGGWVEVLTGNNVRAVKVLGLTEDQGLRLFYPPGLVEEEGQTIEHATAVVAHITAFQALHEARLKAKAVTPC